MTRKLKTTLRRIENREGMEAVVREICLQSIVRDEQHAMLDRDIAACRQRYEETIGATEAALKELQAQAKDWADRNPDVFATAKSIIMAHGTVGYRTNPPKLTTTKGVTWSMVLEYLERYLPDYVRRKTEADKSKLLADREGLADRLGKAGLEVVQEEQFFVEPKREALLAEVAS